MAGLARRATVLLALTAVVALPGGAVASEPVPWVVMGNASAGLDLPRMCQGRECAGGALPAAWPATSVAPWLTTVAALPDGTLALRSNDHPGLVRLDLDGRLRPWLVQREPGAAPAPLDPLAIDAAPDGSLVTLVAQPDSEVADVLRVTPDGRATRIAQIPQGADVAALPGGDALVAGDERVWRVRADGAVIAAAGTGRPGFAGDGGPATSARLDRPGSLAALPDGGFLVVDSGNSRVRRVAPDGTISTVLGDGRVRSTYTRSWRDGAVATRVDAAEVGFVHAAPEGGFFFGHHEGGLYRVDTAGRVRWPPSRELRGPDGSTATPIALDVLADGSLALISNDGRQAQVRVFAPLERMQRLVVSFTARNRRPVPRDEVEVLATRAARASIDVSARGRILARTEVDLGAGLNRVPLPIRPSGDVRVLRVRAHAADGAVAAQRLAVIPGPRLSRRALLRTLGELQGSRGDLTYAVTQRGCRRTGARRFVCTTFESRDTGPFVRQGRSSVRLRSDGLIELVEPQGRERVRLTLEPES